jgi:hypothetical protein
MILSINAAAAASPAPQIHSCHALPLHRCHRFEGRHLAYRMVSDSSALDSCLRHACRLAGSSSHGPR